MTDFGQQDTNYDVVKLLAVKLVVLRSITRDVMRLEDALLELRMICDLFPPSRSFLLFRCEKIEFSFLPFAIKATVEVLSTSRNPGYGALITFEQETCEQRPPSSFILLSPVSLYTRRAAPLRHISSFIHINI